MGKWKSLGLALLTVFAVGAFMASAASASEFHVENAPDTLFGEQEGENSLGSEFGALTCKALTWSGSQEGSTTTSEFELEPSSGECADAGAAAKVDWNGCKYQFTSNQIMHIKCPVGKLIEVTATGCTITWPPQTVSAGIVYTNLGAGKGRFITAHVTTNSLVYEEHGIFCKNKTILKTNGTYKGTVKIKVKTKEGAEEGFWWE